MIVGWPFAKEQDSRLAKQEPTVDSMSLPAAEVEPNSVQKV